MPANASPSDVGLSDHRPFAASVSEEKPLSGAAHPFEPVTPRQLATRLATWIDTTAAERLAVGFDGDDTVGTSELADDVAAALLDRGRPGIRISTRWWWRAASLRLEYGKRDVESRLSSWVDVGALRREVIEPLAVDGSGRYLTRLRDPIRDRAIRDTHLDAPPDAVLLLNGPLLATHELPLDLLVRIGVSAGRLARALPDDRQWETEAFAEYGRRWPPPPVVLSYDHPSTPAVRGLSRRG